MTFFKTNVAGFSTSTVYNLVIISVIPTRFMSARATALPSRLFLKFQNRYVFTDDKLGSSDHFIFAVDPFEKIKMFPADGGMIFPKKRKKIQYFESKIMNCDKTTGQKAAIT